MIADPEREWIIAEFAVRKLRRGLESRGLTLDFIEGEAAKYAFAGMISDDEPIMKVYEFEEHIPELVDRFVRLCVKIATLGDAK